MRKAPDPKIVGLKKSDIKIEVEIEEVAEIVYLCPLDRKVVDQVKITMGDGRRKAVNRWICPGCRSSYYRHQLLKKRHPKPETEEDPPM